MTQQGITLLREMITMLEGQERVADKKLLEKVKELEQVMNTSLQEHERKLLELMRHSTHYMNVWSVCAPPNQPELQTVPWLVGHHNTTVAPKGELSKRTMDALPTVQKSQAKEKKKRKNNKRN